MRCVSLCGLAKNKINHLSWVHIFTSKAKYEKFWTIIWSKMWKYSIPYFPNFVTYFWRNFGLPESDEKNSIIFSQITWSENIIWILFWQCSTKSRKYGPYSVFQFEILLLIKLSIDCSSYRPSYLCLCHYLLTQVIEDMWVILYYVRFKIVKRCLASGPALLVTSDS